MSTVGFGAVLMAIWLLLWGSITVANVLSGLAVVALILLVMPDARFAERVPTFRPVALARLFGRIVVDLLRANLRVTREILTRESRIHAGIVKVPLPFCSDSLLTFVADVLALSPGLMPLEVHRTPATIWVHVLHLDDPDETRREVRALAERAVRAFGSAEAIAAFDGAGPAIEIADDMVIGDDVELGEVDR